MEETTTPSVANEAAPQAIKVKFNHEEKEIPISEAQILAQKGMNYDKVAERLQAYESDETIKQVDRLASELGVTRKDVLTKWIEEATASKAAQLAESTDPAELAKQLLETKTERDLTKKERDALKAAQEQQERIDHQISEFTKAYPNVKLDEIPGEVLDIARDEGTSLKLAYKAYLADVLAKEKEALEQQLGVKNVNDANADSSMGSAQSSGTTQPAELSEESIRKMTPAEKRANMPRILEWMKKPK